MTRPEARACRVSLLSLPRALPCLFTPFLSSAAPCPWRRPTPEVWGYFSVKSGGGIHEFSDSQFGHLFAHGPTREAALRAMAVALGDVSIRGEIRTTVRRPRARTHASMGGPQGLGSCAVHGPPTYAHAQQRVLLDGMPLHS